MSYIDQNTKNVGLGFVHGTVDMVLPFSINTSDELLIEIIPVGPLANLNASGISIDENTHQIGGAVTDDVNEDITPLTVDEIVGFPCLRVEDPNLP